jgi:hypothetical protein
MKNKIFVEGDETFDELIKKIKKIDGSALTLVIPKSAKIFSKTNLQALAKYLVDQQLSVVLQSNDPSGLAQAKTLGFSVINSNQPNSKTAPAPLGAKASEKIKIVYKKKPAVAKITTVKPKALPHVAKPTAETKSEETKTAKTSFISQLFFGALSIISIVIVFAVLLLIVPTTDINITAQAQKVPFKSVITVDSKQTSTDFINNILPGQLVTTPEEITLEERATGEINNGNKASGTITVHNQASAEVPLVANTRFLSDSGQLFRTTGAVNVPGSGTATVNVVADQAGQQGNIGPAKFTLPALPDSGSYIYGQSSSAMSGGDDNISYQITESDLNYSQTEIANKILDAATKNLLAKLPQGRQYFSVEAKDLKLDIKPDHQVGDQVDTFHLVAKADIPFLIYDEKDLQDLLSKNMSQLVTGQYQLAPESLKSVATKLTNLDLAANKATVEVSATTLAIPQYDVSKIQNDLAGKSSEEVKEYFLSYPDIQQIEIKFWPDFVNRVSKLPSRISINIKY